MEVHVLHEPELRRYVGIDHGSLECIADCFGWLHDGLAMVPPVARIEAADRHGEVDIKAAYVQGLDRFAVKIASGFPGNVDLGLPTGSGMMVVFSSETGFCEAVLLDNGYLTDLRTGLAGAVVAEHLAREEIETVGIVGAGVQARYQLRCLSLVRRFRRAVAWSRSRKRLESFADDLRSNDGVEIELADSAEAVVRAADLLITVTAGSTPLVFAEWLKPGLHITAVGADFPDKQELDAGVLERADRLFCDRIEQCRRMGELQHWRGKNPPSVTEIGSVIRGAAPGRQDDRQITVCDLTGVGVQDTAIANRACARARAAGHTPA